MSLSHNFVSLPDALDLQLDSDDLLAHIALDDAPLALSFEQEPATFVDMLADLDTISSAINSVDERVQARRQQRRSVSSSVASKSTPRSRKASTSSEGASAAPPVAKAKPSAGKAANNKRKKDDDALDCIYDELQDSAGMCRYWGKKCWNLRVAKPKGGFHSLCHFHRAKANDNQRRFDYKRRGTLWREFETDPDAEDISLFPAVPSEGLNVFTVVGPEDQSRPETVAKFEPFARPVALQEQDVELLQELVGAATI